MHGTMNLKFISWWFKGLWLLPYSGLAVHVITACTRTWCNESLATPLWELHILQVFLLFNYFIWNLLFVLIRHVEFVYSILNYRFIGNIWNCLHLLSVPHIEAMWILDGPNSVPYVTRRTYLISSFVSCCLLRWISVQLLSFMQAFEVLQWGYVCLNSSWKWRCVFDYIPAFHRTLSVSYLDPGSLGISPRRWRPHDSLQHW
jgi:hypothetical protein